MDYYVLYCCQRCHGQFREKEDLVEHQRACPPIEGVKEKLKNTEQSAKEQHISQSSKIDSPRKLEEGVSENKNDAIKTRRNPERKSRQSSSARSADQMESRVTSKPKHCPEEFADVNSHGKRGRSQREIKPTAKFKEYLQDQKSQSDNIRMEEERKKYRRGMKTESIKANKEMEQKIDFKYKKKICSIGKNASPAQAQDEGRTHIISSESNPNRKNNRPENSSEMESTTTGYAISKTEYSDKPEIRQELEEVLLDKCQNIKKKTLDGSVAVSVLESTESINKHSGGNKDVFEEISASYMDQHKKTKRGRKRTATYNETKLCIKSKKLSNLAVSLRDHPESYCIEEYVSTDPLDKGKSASEKLYLRYLCKLCNAYRTVSKDQMEKHIALHVNKKLTCQHCDNVFNSLHNLYAHVRQEHQLGILCECEHCGEDFSEKRLYKIHLSKIHKEAAFKCSRCDKRFLSNNEYKQHRLNDHENLAFKCEKCDGIFLTEKLLENHKTNNICEVKSFKCQHCPSMKKSKALLDEHVRKVHSKEHRYKCNLCTYSTGMNYMLKQHMRAHLGIHPHKCDQCKFTCVKKWQLTSHMRTHSGEKKYKCDKCNYAAGWNVQVKSHMKAHESDTQQVCKICNIVFKDMRCFDIHTHKEHIKTKKLRYGATVNRRSNKQQNMVIVEGTNLVVYKTSGSNQETDIIIDRGIVTEGNKIAVGNKKEVVTDNSCTYTGARASPEASLTNQDTAVCQSIADMTPLLATLPRLPTLRPRTEKVTGESVINSNANVQTVTVTKCSADMHLRNVTPEKITKNPENTDSDGFDTDHMHVITKTGNGSDGASQISESMAYPSKSKTANSSVSEMSELIVTDQVPSTRKEAVTYIRLYINPDGTRRFETVAPKIISSSQTSESVNITSERTTSCPLSVASNSTQTQSTHNYALPAYKRKTFHENDTASNCIHALEKAFNIPSPTPYQRRENQSTLTNVVKNNTVPSSTTTTMVLTGNVTTPVFTGNKETGTMLPDTVTTTECADVESKTTAAVCDDNIDGTDAALADSVDVKTSTDNTASGAALLTENVEGQFENQYNTGIEITSNIVLLGTDNPDSVYEVVSQEEIQ